MQLSIQGLVPIPLREKVYGRSSGIWNSTFMASKGACIFVKAPSGTGKTTFIHMLYGLRSDYEGDIRWDDDKLSSMQDQDISELRAKQLSIIFQDLRLFPALTVVENIEIKRQLANTVPFQKVVEWMTRLGIADKQQSFAATLSYGERQRVAIIRALTQPFSWLLMDEPFSHLDHANARKAAELIAEVARETNAGLLIADLDDNDHFMYNQVINL